MSVGLCLAWDPTSQILAGAGDTKHVRLWDCKAEVKTTDLPSATDSYVTCLNMNESARLLAASHYDGSIRLYDPRLPPASARLVEQKFPPRIRIRTLTDITFLKVFGVLFFST